MANQAPLTPLEVPKDSNQGDGQGKKAEDPKGMNKGQDKKNPSDPKEKVSNTAASQLGQTVDLEISKTTV